MKLNNKLKFIKSNNDNIIKFLLIFPKYYDNKENYYIRILNNIICTTSKKYPKEELYEKKKLECLALSNNLSSINSPNNRCIMYSFTIPNIDIISDYNIQDAFNFMMDSLFDPNIINNSFSEEKFNYEKDYFLDSLKKNEDNMYYMNSDAYYNIIDKERYLGLNHQEEIEVLNNINSTNLFTYYEKEIKNSFFVPYIYGNVDKKIIHNLFENYFNIKEQEINYNVNNFKLLPLNTYKYQEFTTKFNQSELFMCYQVENMTYDEYIYLFLLVDILDNSNRLLFNTVRGKHNLVYDIYINSHIKYGLFNIISYINPKDKDKIITLIQEIILSLKDKDYLIKNIKNVEERIKLELLRYEDSEDYICIKTIKQAFKYEEISDIYKMISEIDIDYFIKFLDRVINTSTCLFRGEDK